MEKGGVLQTSMHDKILPCRTSNPAREVRRLEILHRPGPHAYVAHLTLDTGILLYPELS
jgi:hypothetical protein